MTSFYGSFSALIVGRRYYSTETALGQIVMFERQPCNPHDKNAIVALDHGTNTGVLGHLPRWLALVLAPCMDKAGCSLQGKISGIGNAYTTPVEIEIYAPASASEQLFSMLDSYWHMWQLRAPENAADKQIPTVHSSGSSIDLSSLEDDFFDFGADLDLDIDFDADIEKCLVSADSARLSAQAEFRSATYADDQACHESFRKLSTAAAQGQRVLVIGAQSSFSAWASQLNRRKLSFGIGNKENWFVYNAQNTDALDISRSRRIYVPLDAVDQFIKLTHNIHFHVIAVDQKSVGKIGSMSYMLSAFLNFRYLTATVVYL
ncbi:hypothetical protein H4R99_003686 [Coemansia sp. RSA 1722]|nr:hypothetical protein IWW45_002936 [Coemansia sp. RSA 485]KAJ2599526.1 hypothetical protein H4R99_003686 [Coemansia sp. RSA 1722]